MEDLPHYVAIPQFNRMRKDYLYADIWEQPELSPRDKSLVTCAILGALGKSVPALAFARAEPWRRLFGLPLGFFPATAAIVVLLQSVVLWLIVIATWIESRAPWEARSWIVALGRISLTLLLVHVVVFRELTRPVGLWQALDAEAALAVIGLWTILCAVIARAWQKHGYRYGAEWLLRRVAG